MKEFQMMKRLIKFGVMSLFVLISSIISFSYGYEYFNSNGGWVDLSSNTTFNLLSGQGVCFFRNQSYITNCPIEGHQLSNLNLMCFYNNSLSSESVTTNCNFNGRSIYYWTFSKDITTCPTCSECSVNECVLDVIQGGVYDSYTCSGDCNFSFYLDDNILYTGYDYPGNNPYIEVTPICSLSSGGDLTGINRSILHINDIEHIGAGFINITIPEEFDWDYLYTGNGEELDIDIKGYNVDTAYIDGLITTQRTLPNNTDFNNTISGLLPLFVPGIVIIFFLYFIFRFIKKVF